MSESGPVNVSGDMLIRAIKVPSQHHVTPSAAKRCRALHYRSAHVCLGPGLVARAMFRFGPASKVIWDILGFVGPFFFFPRRKCYSQLRSFYARDTVRLRKQIPPTWLYRGFSQLPPPTNSSLQHLTNLASGIFLPVLKRQYNLRCSQSVVK
jgi:hypothetical protein